MESISSDIKSTARLPPSCVFKSSFFFVIFLERKFENFESAELIVDGGAKQNLIIIQGYREILLAVYLFPRRQLLENQLTSFCMGLLNVYFK
ncbi:hypothetical protein C5167_006190 [Papaver somniferum]|uniref:Uncharacterized protein n=1 Tax=Papaver somniferum TaxID=3469 RepID=A0A4Y7JDK9_PAPSO|nr:hypothetical protein C5167_006190 [Papaver somniferum]